MLISLYEIMLLATPLVLLLFSGVNIYRYYVARKANKVNPNTYSKQEMRMRMILAIISIIITGFIILIVIGIIMIMFGAIAFM